MNRTAIALALGVGLATAALAAVAPAGQRTPDPVRARVDDARTTLTLTDAAADRHLLVALPPDATTCEARVIGGAGEVRVERVMRLRGLPVASLAATGLDGDARIDLSHDGSWAAKAAAPVRAHSRGFDAAVSALVSGLPKAAESEANGTYLVMTTSEYAAACEPLVAWKREKGFTTRLATTDEFGVDNASIREWLRTAYATWDVPPEYVLLVGDVDDIPSWSISEDVTDHPYTLMDDDDFLPDLMLGRMPVETAYQAQTVINKSVGYEQSPYRDDADWFRRQLMVAGNYSSDTPVSTVSWVGEQLQALGFEAPSEVFFPPLYNGVYPITQALETGVSMVVYRGWAYGTAGWEPPHFTVEDIPNVDNGAMLPVVMSFVCLNGDFSDDEPCFGEVFLRQGSPSEPRGAVAFIGNGEHWSHTRYNDAMAISFFEDVDDPGLSDLGRLTVAGKLRFMDFFPHELSYEEFGEESVEFYLHIYNLLGDPELNFWRGDTGALVATHDASCPPAATRFDVSVTEADGTTPLAGARVGVVRGDTLIGTAFSGDDGVARVAVSGLSAGESLVVTVTASDRFPYQAVVPVAQPAAHLAVGGFTWTNPTGLGNDDAVINPAEVFLLRPEITNTGTAAATGVTLTVAVEGPCEAEVAEIALGDIAAGETYACGTDEYFRIGLLTQADDGTELRLHVDAVHDDGVDASEIVLAVGGPTIDVADLSVGGDGVLRQGEVNAILLSVTNSGGLPLSNPRARLNLVTDGVGTVVVDDVSLPDVPSGATVAAEATFRLELDADVPTGRGVLLQVVVSDDGEWYQSMQTRELIVGEIDAGAPVGPDAYGYWALDSADIDYPASVPTYRWTHLNPAYGGEGDTIRFDTDNACVLTDLPFPFTYYGQSYDGQIRISENGWISFDTSDEFEFYNWPLPNPHGNHSVVAPFWDNFRATHPDTSGVYTHYDAVAGTFTVEWSRMEHYLSTVEDADDGPIDDLQTFQMVLYDPSVHPTTTGDGEILFLYRQVTNADYLRQYATVGMENADEDDGLELSYAGLYADGAAPIGPGLAVKLTTETPVYDPYVVPVLHLARLDGGVEISWEVDDPRPVLGWSVVRIDADGETTLNDAMLPAGTRSLLDVGAGEAASYRLVSHHAYGHRGAAGVAALETTTLSLFALHPVQPNPVRGETRLSFSLSAAGPVTLKVYDLAGRLVKTLLEDEMPAGPGILVWDGRDAAGRETAAGVYFARLESRGLVRTQKLLMVK